MVLSLHEHRSLPQVSDAPIFVVVCTLWLLPGWSIGRGASPMIAYASRPYKPEYLSLQGLSVFLFSLFCRLRRRSGVRGCEDTSRSGRRARRPPAPPALTTS